jgi:hypothetical protein
VKVGVHNGTDSPGHVAFGCASCIAKRDEVVEQSEVEAQVICERLEEKGLEVEKSIENLFEQLQADSQRWWQSSGEGLQALWDKYETKLQDAAAQAGKLADLDATSELMSKLEEANKRVAAQEEIITTFRATHESELAGLRLQVSEVVTERDELLTMLENMTP